MPSSWPRALVAPPWEPLPRWEPRGSPGESISSSRRSKNSNTMFRSSTILIHFVYLPYYTILYKYGLSYIYIYASFDFLRTARIPTACLDGICAITALKVIRTYPFSHSGESMPWICVGTRQSFHTNRGCLCQLEECFFCKAWKSLWKLQHPFGWRRVFENRHGDCRILRDKSACFYLQYLVQNA